MKIEKHEFPSDVKERLKKKIKKSIKMQFFDGASIVPEQFNFTILESHRVLFKNRNNFIIGIIIEVEPEPASAKDYDVFINSVSAEAKISLNGLINFVNANL